MDTVIYIRWSTAEQADGHTKERQLELCRKFATAQGWNVVGLLIEEGVSAYRGENLLNGKLGEFQRDVESGKFPAGVVLLVERLDRLSREAPAKFLAWLTRMLDYGVEIAPVDRGRAYTKSSLDMTAIIEIVVQSSLANDHSKGTSDRVSKAWASKRERLANGSGEIFTKRVPGWLSVESKKQCFVIHPDRAQIVKRIFEATADGQGKNAIAHALNEESVPTFGKSQAWHSSYIQKILCNRSVLGEFQPGTKPRGAQRKLVDEPIPGYYPAIIDADLYARAQSAIASRTRMNRGRGRGIANLFAGMGRCAVCHGKMTLRSKGSRQLADGRTVRDDYLVCDNRQRGIRLASGDKCHNDVKFKYSILENRVLDAILAEAIDDTHFQDGSKAHKLQIELAAAELEMQRLDRRAGLLIDMLGTDKDDEKISSAYKINKVRMDELRATMDSLGKELLKALGQVSPEEHSARISKLRSDMNSADDGLRTRARSSVRLALGELIEEMTFHRKGKRVGLRLLSSSRNIVISMTSDSISLDIRSVALNDQNNELTPRQIRSLDRVLSSNKSHAKL